MTPPFDSRPYSVCDYSHSPYHSTIPETIANFRIVVTDHSHRVGRAVSIVKDDNYPELQAGCGFVVMERSGDEEVLDTFVAVANGHTVARLVVTDDSSLAYYKTKDLYALEVVILPK